MPMAQAVFCLVEGVLSKADIEGTIACGLNSAMTKYAGNPSINLIAYYPLTSSAVRIIRSSWINPGIQPHWTHLEALTPAQKEPILRSTNLISPLPSQTRMETDFPTLATTVLMKPIVRRILIWMEWEMPATIVQTHIPLMEFKRTQMATERGMPVTTAVALPSLVDGNEIKCCLVP